MGPTPEIIRFFPDTGAEHPLWDEDGHLYDIDDLPISAELRADLETWSDEAGWYDGRNPKRLRELREIGRALCERTVKALGPAFEVRWEWDMSE